MASDCEIYRGDEARGAVRERVAVPTGEVGILLPVPRRSDPLDRAVATGLWRKLGFEWAELTTIPLRATPILP